MRFRPGRVALWPLLAPLLLATLLWVPKNLGALRGLADPPAGYRGLGVYVASDILQYMTWSRAMEKDFFIENYHAPYQTEAAFLNPVLFAMGRIRALFDLDPGWMLCAASFLLYVAAAAGWLFAIRVFAEDAAQGRAAIVASLCSLPMAAILLFPATLAGTPVPPGLAPLVLVTSDGFLHGFPGSFLVTFGTATVLVFFAFLGRYVQSGRRSDLFLACLVAFVSAAGHPFEIVVIVGGGGIGLLLARPRGLQRAFLDSCAVAAAGFLGVLPYLVQALRYPWVGYAASLNRWIPPLPHRLLWVLGLTTVACLLLLAIRQKMQRPADRILQGWFVAVLVGVYLPGVPWAQHLLDGFFCGVGLLLVRQIVSYPSLHRFLLKMPGWRFAVGLFLAGSLSAYGTVAYLSFKDGNKTQPGYFPPAILSLEHDAVLQWLRQNSEPNSVVLAPGMEAALYATVPVHSVGSHFLFSLSHKEQREFIDRFYEGSLTNDQAAQRLQAYGVRYVVVRKNSAARAYLEQARRVAQIGETEIFEFSENSIRPIPADLFSAPRGNDSGGAL